MRQHVDFCGSRRAQRIRAAGVCNQPAALVAPSAAANVPDLTTGVHWFGTVEGQEHASLRSLVLRTNPEQCEEVTAVVRARFGDTPSLAADADAVANSRGQILHGSSIARCAPIAS
jgi:hypothetical protein